MIKKVAISEIGISINGLNAINQLRKKKKITSTTSIKAMISVSFTSDNDCRMLTGVIDQHIDFYIRFVGSFYLVESFIELICDFNVVGARLGNDCQSYCIYTIVFPALFQSSADPVPPGPYHPGAQCRRCLLG